MLVIGRRTDRSAFEPTLDATNWSSKVNVSLEIDRKTNEDYWNKKIMNPQFFTNKPNKHTINSKILSFAFKIFQFVKILFTKTRISKTFLSQITF